MKPISKIGPYLLLTKLAEGGYCDVWLASHRGSSGFKRRCALKVLRPGHNNQAGAEKSFIAEARLMTLFDHPNLLEATDFGLDDDVGVFYLALPYVAGQSLAALLASCRRSPYFDLPEILWASVAVLSALHEVHTLRDERNRQLGVIHRDVSPENVLISYHGQLKLIDFGIALSTLAPRLTSAFSVKGKLEYLAPEQARGELELDARTDLYQVGLMLYHMLSGVNPLGDAPLPTALAKARTPEFAPLHTITEIPGSLSELVHRMLQLRPDDRPDSAMVCAMALNEILHQTRPGYSQMHFRSNMTELLREDYLQELEFLAALEHGTQVISTPPETTQPVSGESSTSARDPDEVTKVHTVPVELPEDSDDFDDLPPLGRKEATEEITSAELPLQESTEEIDAASDPAMRTPRAKLHTLPIVTTPDDLGDEAERLIDELATRENASKRDRVRAALAANSGASRDDGDPTQPQDRAEIVEILDALEEIYENDD